MTLQVSPQTKRVFHLSLPIFAELLLQLLVGNMDQFMISHFGSAAVAAIGNGNQVMNVVIIVLTTMSTAATILLTQHIGAGRVGEECSEIVTVAVTVSAVFSFLVGLFLLLEPELVFQLLRTPEDAFDGACLYTRIVGGTVLLQGLYIQLCAVLRSYTLLKEVVVLSVSMNLLNVVGNAILINGFFGFPQMGVAGAAVSTVISKAVGLTLACITLKRKCTVRFSLQYLHPFPAKTFRALLGIALPSGTEALSYNVSQTFILRFINLMGAVGGVFYLAFAAILYPNSKVKALEEAGKHVDYQPLFLIVSAVMFLAVGILFLTIRERKLTEENHALEAQHPEWNLAVDDGSGNEALPKPVKRSLAFLLASIALWFIGYNGVTTWFSTYVDVVMGQGLGGASQCLLIATVGAVVSYIPIGALAAKIGRKRTIQIGIVLLAACFAMGYVLTTMYATITPVMFVVFALVGFAWAAINVNSLPMVVEMCKGSDIGKFTGYYYTASMAAQVVTPVLAGTLMRQIDYRVLFPYAALFVALSFVTMLFVRHGDVKAAAKKGLEAFEDMED